jgi:hypothetical protein
MGRGVGCGFRVSVCVGKRHSTKNEKPAFEDHYLFAKTPADKKKAPPRRSGEPALWVGAERWASCVPNARARKMRLKKRAWRSQVVQKKRRATASRWR